MQKPQLYIDMDGVLADFLGGVTEIYDKTTDNYPKGLYDVETFVDVSRARMWKDIDDRGEAFWSTLPPLQSGLNMWLKLEHLNPIVLTSPSISPACVAGKLQWLQNCFGSSFRDYIFCPAHHKQQLARDNAVLVDDSVKNCEEFVTAGGAAVVWPSLSNDVEEAKQPRAISELKFYFEILNNEE